MKEQNTSLPAHIETVGSYDVSRRRFFQVAGGFAAAGAFLAACKKKSNDGINLGSGDVGILNYAYSLEQLEAAFYTQVIANPYVGIPSQEMQWLTNIRDHEVAHREFYKTALATSAIQKLDFDFSAINFTDRTAVLTAAKTFEDLGVSAYNGAARLISNTDYLLVAGKIATVEARHAAYIRDLLSPGTFADGDVINSSGLDVKNSPIAVLTAASTYIKNKLDGSNLPNS